jgi:hypothetical protein
MPNDEACLLDSNILLRISKSDDPQHAAISHALHTLVGQGLRLCYTSQTLGEFWNASTRPLDKNGFGLSVPETDRLARVIEQDFGFMPGSQAAMSSLIGASGAGFSGILPFLLCLASSAFNSAPTSMANPVQ